MEHIKNGTADKSGESDKIINISILIQYIQSFFERFFTVHAAERCNKSCNLYDLTSF